MGLEAAQKIGGVAVVIGADLTHLRAGEREAKAIAQGIERNVRIVIPMVLDTSRLRAEIPRAVSAAQSIATTMPIRIPVVLDMSAVRGQLAAMGGSGGIPWGGGPSRVSAPGAGGGFLPGPGNALAPSSGLGPIPTVTTLNQRALPAPGGGAAVITGGGGTQYAPIGRAGGGAGGGGGGAGTDQLRTMSQFIGRGTKVLAIAEAAMGAIGGGYQAYRAASYDTSTDAGMSQRQAAIEAGQGYISAIPFAGNIINRLGYGAYAAVSATKNLVTGHGFRTDYGIAEDTRAEADAQDQRIAARAPSVAARREGILSSEAATRRINLANGADGLTAGEAGTAQARFGLSEFNLNNNSSSPEILAQRAALTKAVAIAANNQRIESGVFNRSIAGAVGQAAFGSAGLRAYAAGDTDAAAKAERDAQRLGLVTQHGNALATAPDSQKAGLKTANAAELKLFDEQSAKEAADRIKQRAADLYQTIGSKQSAALIVSKQYHAAELASFDATTKAELALIDDKTAKQNAAGRAAAQRSVIVAQEGQRLNEQRIGTDTRVAVAGLRAGNRNFDAELAQFDASAGERRRQIAPGTPEYARELRASAAERKALVADQGRQQKVANIGYQARIDQSGAFSRAGVYQPQVAGLIGQLAGFDAELVGADQKDRPQVVKAQTAQLRAERRQIAAAGASAYSEYRDPRRDASTPDAGAEQTKLLNLIEQHLRKLSGDDAGSVAGSTVP